jgi:hypothetical protein
LIGLGEGACRAKLNAEPAVAADFFVQRNVKIYDNLGVESPVAGAVHPFFGQIVAGADASAA